MAGFGDDVVGVRVMRSFAQAVLIVFAVLILTAIIVEAEEVEVEIERAASKEVRQ